MFKLSHDILVEVEKNEYIQVTGVELTGFGNLSDKPDKGIQTYAITTHTQRPWEGPYISMCLLLGTYLTLE